MLGKHVARLTAPVCAHHASSAAAAAATLQCARPHRAIATLSRPAARAVHTPFSSVSLPAAGALAAAAKSAAGVHTAAIAASASSASAEDLSALRVLAAGALAGLLAYGISQLEDEQFTELRSQLSAKLRELQSMAGLGIQTAACEGVIKANFETASAAFAANKIIGEDHELASWWRRFAAYLLDNGLVMLLDVVSASLLNLVFLGDSWSRVLELTLSGGSFNITELLISAFSVIAWEVMWLVVMDGQTPAKMLLGIRVVKQDFTPMDWSTALKLSATRAALMPPMAADVLIPRVLYKPIRRFTGTDLSADKLALHNLASGTIVIDTHTDSAEEADE